ncbi:alanine dehydrogenase [uncultured Piscinibacter sp.]|uniref:alanine dehydrogenase n=1 Tax=uncultured Piscinibacter sp. TaxID=1131835 RepID=UPI002605DB2D|nr:alanine dehydrogenase [uncultured Piscinibacter sp.]
MRIGVPTEIKVHEHRVGLTPSSVRELCAHGHEVLVQCGAGAAAGLDDGQYRAAGATLVDDAQAVFSGAQLIVKVKEPQPQEVRWLRPGQVLFTYLHLAADAALARALLASGAVAIAYETVTGPGGRLPLLAPMSEVAGRMAIQVGASCLEQPRGGRGVLLGGVPGVPAAQVVILGAGVVGTNALQAAVGLGARVAILDHDLDRLRQLDLTFGNRVMTRYATTQALEDSVAAADLVVGAVLVPGATAPRLVARTMVAGMRRGAVIVDVAIDQGGCVETSRPTTHAEPTYVVDGVVHYAVTNMPGAVPRTSTFALNHATLAHVLALADQGWRQATLDDPHLRAGLNVVEGRLAHDALARSLGLSPAQAPAARR